MVRESVPLVLFTSDLLSLAFSEVLVRRVVCVQVMVRPLNALGLPVWVFLSVRVRVKKLLGVAMELVSMVSIALVETLLLWVTRRTWFRTNVPMLLVIPLVLNLTFRLVRDLRVVVMSGLQLMRRWLCRTAMMLTVV